jgi:hypothetical protein
VILAVTSAARPRPAVIESFRSLAWRVGGPPCVNFQKTNRGLVLGTFPTVHDGLTSSSSTTKFPDQVAPLSARPNGIESNTIRPALGIASRMRMYLWSAW